MTFYIDLVDLLWFAVTVVCGLAFGFKCYKDGLDKGASDMIEYLEGEGIIFVDPETGEITKVS